MDYLKLETELIRDEGYRDRPYRDTTGHLSIGVGHNLDSEGLCAEAIMAQLRFDIRTKALTPLDKNLSWWRETPENVQRVLVNLCFNMGIKTLLTFRATLAAIRESRYSQAASNLLDSLYARQVGERAQRLAKMLSELGEI